MFLSVIDDDGDDADEEKNCNDDEEDDYNDTANNQDDDTYDDNVEQSIDTKAGTSFSHEVLKPGQVPVGSIVRVVQGIS